MHILHNALHLLSKCIYLLSLGTLVFQWPCFSRTHSCGMNQSDLNSSLVRDTAVKKEKQKNKQGKLQSQRDQRIMLFHRDIPIEL